MARTSERIFRDVIRYQNYAKYGMSLAPTSLQLCYTLKIKLGIEIAVKEFNTNCTRKCSE